MLSACDPEPGVLTMQLQQSTPNIRDFLDKSDSWDFYSGYRAAQLLGILVILAPFGFGLSLLIGLHNSPDFIHQVVTRLDSFLLGETERLPQFLQFFIEFLGNFEIAARTPFGPYIAFLWLLSHWVGIIALSGITLRLARRAAGIACSGDELWRRDLSGAGMMVLSVLMALWLYRGGPSRVMEAISIDQHPVGLLIYGGFFSLSLYLFHSAAITLLPLYWRRTWQRIMLKEQLREHLRSLLGVSQADAGPVYRYLTLGGQYGLIEPEVPQIRNWFLTPAIFTMLLLGGQALLPMLSPELLEAFRPLQENIPSYWLKTLATFPISFDEVANAEPYFGLIYLSLLSVTVICAAMLMRQLLRYTRQERFITYRQYYQNPLYHAWQGALIVLSLGGAFYSLIIGVDPIFLWKGRPEFDWFPELLAGPIAILFTAWVAVRYIGVRRIAHLIKESPQGDFHFARGGGGPSRKVASYQLSAMAGVSSVV